MAEALSSSSFQISDCDQPVHQRSYWPENAIDWPARDHGNGTRNATCADTQTSIEWPYCPFAILCRRPFDKAETYTRQGIVAQRVIM